MSSISVRFNSFLFFYSIFNEHKRTAIPFLLGISVQLTIGNELWFTLCTSPSGGCRHCRLVGLDGFEPSTSRLSGARSNHLSYKPLLCVDSSHLSARVLLTLLSLVHSFSYEFRVMSYGVAFKRA